MLPLLLLLFEARQHDGKEELDGDNAGTEFAVWHFTRRATSSKQTNQIHSLNFPLSFSLKERLYCANNNKRQFGKSEMATLNSDKNSASHIKILILWNSVQADKQNL